MHITFRQPCTMSFQGMSVWCDYENVYVLSVCAVEKCPKKLLEKMFRLWFETFTQTTTSENLDEIHKL